MVIKKGRQGQMGHDQLKVGTAMEAEVIDTCVLTKVLDLFFNKCLCIQNINRCMDKILDEQ